jgi:Na+/phosphate symporter
VTSPTPPPPKRSRKKAKRVALAALLGSSIGVLCAFLPPQYHLVCSVAAKVVGLLVGSP